MGVVNFKRQKVVKLKRRRVVNLSGISTLPILFFRKTIWKVIQLITGRFRIFIIHHRTSLQRIGAFILGLIFVFILLEISLRIIGFIHNKNHIEKQIGSSVKVQNTIICAGDSFTESFGADPGFDYPAQLAEIIGKSYPSTYTVYNFGRSGKNSMQIVNEIPRYISKYKPRFIVFMAGGANYWNTWGYQPESWWESLRTVKLIKLIISNIIAERNKNSFSSEEYSNRRIQFQESLILDTADFSETIRAIRTHNNDSIGKTTSLLMSQRRLTQQDIYHLVLYSFFSKGFQLPENLGNFILPSSERVRFFYDFKISIDNNTSLDDTKLKPEFKAMYYYLSYVMQGKRDIGMLKKCIQVFPYLEDTYMELFRSGEKGIQLPEEYFAKRYSLNDSVFYFRVLLGFEKTTDDFNAVNIIENTEKTASTFETNNWVKNNLAAIVITCKNNGVIPILMCYPFQYKSSISYPVNNVIRSVAKENNVLLVDNEMIFDTIKTNRNSYFISDGHCSNKGYGLIAKNLFMVLESNGLLQSEKIDHVH